MKTFVDKYRPERLDGIVGNVQSINELKKIEGKPPHMLFSGKPGTGKTTAAFALCRELLGPQWRRDTKFLNASMDRGIDVIRDEVRQFASTKSLGGKFKIIILDEADELTRNAQQALRGTMEEFSSNTSFIITCNHPERITQAIKSRCKNYHFKPISIDQTMKLIAKVCAEERIMVEPNVAKALAEKGRGDMRQILYDLEFFKRKGGRILMSDLNSLPVSELENTIKYILDGDFPKAKSGIFQLTSDGVSPDQILYELFNTVMDTKMQPARKLNLLIAVSETDLALKMGTNPEVQLVGLISKIIKEVL